MVKHDVLKFDVAMGYALLVKVAQGADELGKDLLRLRLLHLTVGLTLEETVSGATPDILHDKDDF